MNEKDYGVPNDVDVLTERYDGHWQDRSDWYWFVRLIQEVFELAASLAGIHRDDPNREIAQVGSICKNWLRQRRRSQKEKPQGREYPGVRRTPDRPLDEPGDKPSRPDTQGY